MNECNTCGDTGRWETTLEDDPLRLVDLGPCPEGCPDMRRYTGPLLDATADRPTNPYQARVEAALAAIDTALQVDTSSLTEALPTPEQRLYAEGLGDGIREACKAIRSRLEP